MQKLKTPKLGANGFSRIDFTYCESSANVLYADFEDNTTSNLLALIKTEDGGDNWKILPSPPLSTRTSWFHQTIVVHPEHSDVIVYGNVNYASSSDGGESRKLLESSHADKHLFYFDPTNNDHAISTHDGGIDECFFFNGELNYGGSLRDGFNVTQYYTGDIFPNENRLIGGAQDNGTTSGTDESQVFEKIFGADGGCCAVAYDYPAKEIWKFLM